MEVKPDWRRYCFLADNAVGGNTVALHKNGDEAFSALLGALRGARKYALLEFYAFSDDSVGRVFADALRAKAAEGVPVYLIYDSVGSIRTDRNFFSGLAAAGVKTAEFMPLSLWRVYRNWIKRDHRKLLCVDGETAFVGGFNISADDAPKSLGGRGWKDMLAALRGPAVAGIEKLFWESWAAASPVAGEKAAALPAGKPPKAGETVVSVLSASGIRSSHSIRRGYHYAIDAAVNNICITNAYFLPDFHVYRRLMKAARRGVDVRIITPGETDHPYVRWASWSRYGRLIKSGVKLYEWRGPMLHSKAAVIDGIWASVGSHNLDHRSLHYNLEVNLNVHDREFGAAMTRAFREDLKNSRPVTLAMVRDRSLAEKAASALLYHMRYWL
ncbi:MAG TPA: cardiolipin synthase ClsB [Elusimicrobia bacterium]|nr:MAG: hypothetical protein A2016_02290 [Elusimicrobia bacterium GWF2_62_30]HBA60192.1 cardiolipin synthase ClsB [Elusimicrobiota bacterium]